MLRDGQQFYMFGAALVLFEGIEIKEACELRFRDIVRVRWLAEPMYVLLITGKHRNNKLELTEQKKIRRMPMHRQLAELYEEWKDITKTRLKEKKSGIELKDAYLVRRGQNLTKGVAPELLRAFLKELFEECGIKAPEDIACKSLYVLADSEYNTTEDLKGTAISTPNGIGKSDYNITALLLDADGINYKTDVELIQVSSDACVTAMQNGEISAALLSDTFAYSMVKDGTLKCIRSQLDTDFADRVCCVMAMSGKFVRENPVHAKKVAQAVHKAHSFMRDNPEEATDILMEMGWNGGSREMNVMINNSLQFGLSDEFTKTTLEDFAARYIRLGLIESMDKVEDVMELVWTPVL